MDLAHTLIRFPAVAEEIVGLQRGAIFGAVQRVRKNPIH